MRLSGSVRWWRNGRSSAAASPRCLAFASCLSASLRRAGILTDDDSVEVVHAQAIEPAYVIYDLDHARSVETIVSWLAEQDIHAAGRFGRWEYFNMDHAMKSGQAAAEALIAERQKKPVRR